eukprot:CAMPEP_0117019568 /NCGR_PEP_ID=MMETSP0472-20121206/14998_1 /TAXON_ID=693140 ORGANISM="Tiarina fusus, Strain LIS" /NCGR_SAMPLE_ID=MMETSP0472 /ASSEMBLY_ACC=CAM_ASM_000603 /LENGTH=309 /DNA_ID=CAMNT_0004724567 /DNA_START=57 /DNA_END=986 /DNA_ORIENTATION=+
MTQGASPQPTNPEIKENGKNKESRQPFPCKVYDMLEDAASQGFDDIVAWNSEGNGFMVHNKDKFTKEIIPLYFNQTKYKSFQRQLSLYGFERITVGKNKGLRHHDKLQRGSRQLCREMKPIGYKPRGLEQKEKGSKKSGHKTSSEDSSTSSHTEERQRPQGPTSSAIPAVISSGSLDKDVTFQAVPMRITPDSSPRRVAEISSDESSLSSEDMAFFEGMSFYLMDPPTAPPTVAPVPIKTEPDSFILQNPAESLTRIVSDVLPTVSGEGQLKKAWEIGFAVAMTMDSQTVSPPLEPATWNVLDIPNMGI